MRCLIKNVIFYINLRGFSIKKLINTKILNLFFFIGGLMLIFFSFSLHFSNDPTFLMITHRSYSRICHQMEGRTFFFDKKPMFICSRCFGIYSGVTLLFGLFLISNRIRNKLIRFKSRQILLLSVPLIIDWIINFIFKVDSTNFVRFLTGFLFSLIPVYYLSFLTNTIKK